MEKIKYSFTALPLATSLLYLSICSGCNTDSGVNNKRPLDGQKNTSEVGSDNMHLTGPSDTVDETPKTIFDPDTDLDEYEHTYESCVEQRDLGNSYCDEDFADFPSVPKIGMEEQYKGCIEDVRRVFEECIQKVDCEMWCFDSIGFVFIGREPAANAKKWCSYQHFEYGPQSGLKICRKSTDFNLEAYCHKTQYLVIYADRPPKCVDKENQ